MATKSGKVRVKDCRNGKTFYMVKIIVDSVGSFATVIEPVYCCGVSKEEFFSAFPRWTDWLEKVRV